MSDRDPEPRQPEAKPALVSAIARAMAVEEGGARGDCDCRLCVRGEASFANLAKAAAIAAQRFSERST